MTGLTISSCTCLVLVSAGKTRVYGPCMLPETFLLLTSANLSALHIRVFSIGLHSHMMFSFFSRGSLGRIRTATCTPTSMTDFMIELNPIWQIYTGL